MPMSGAKRDAKWLCQRAAWRTKQQEDDATESGEENSWKRRDWLEKNSHYSLVTGIATIPKPFFLRKKRQFYDHKEAMFFLLTTQSLHTYSIAQIISELTIILTIWTHEHLHTATTLGVGAFCARYFSKYNGHK